MVTLIATESGITLESELPISDSNLNKLNNPVNKDRIAAHLKDMHCDHFVITGDNGQMSHLTLDVKAEVTEEELLRSIKVIKANHDSFLENVERMAEVQVEDKPANKDEESEKRERKLKAAAEMLKMLDDEFEDDDAVIYGTHTGPFFEGFGQVRVDFLKEILDVYIDKHLK